MFARKKLPFAEVKSYFMHDVVVPLFRDFLSDRLLEFMKQKCIKKNRADPDVCERSNKEVSLEKWQRPTSTYTDNLRKLLDDFLMYSSSKTTAHCMNKCNGSVKAATKMCQTIFEGIEGFISSTGLECDYS